MDLEGGWMRIGRVAGAFGVRGEMKVESHSDFPDRFQQLERVYLGPGHRAFEVEHTRPHGSHVLFKLQGIETPEAVRELGQMDVAVPREEAVALPEGHYYLDDLLGAAVETVAGDPVGEISEVLQTGSNDVFVVHQQAGNVLIPATKDAVVELDIAARRVVIEPWVLQTD
ncbi:MAG: ribosome maturation factor RimM [Chloroflexota bacterium]